MRSTAYIPVHMTSFILTYGAEKVFPEDVLRVAENETRLAHAGVAYYHHFQECIKRFHDSPLKLVLACSFLQWLLHAVCYDNILQI